MENTEYIPKVGHIFQWCDEEYLCIKTDKHSGDVIPVGDSCHVNNFYWNYGGEKPKFIREISVEKTEQIKQTEQLN